MFIFEFVNAPNEIFFFFGQLYPFFLFLEYLQLWCIFQIQNFFMIIPMFDLKHIERIEEDFFFTEKIFSQLSYSIQDKKSLLIPKIIQVISQFRYFYCNQHFFMTIKLRHKTFSNLLFQWSWHETEIP